MRLFGRWILAGAICVANAQQVPLQREEEWKETRKQSQELYDVIRPVAQRASASVVQVWANRKWVASGTVVGDGSQVLTKWSEIALARTPVQCVGGDGQSAIATVLGVYQEEDIALLQLDGAQFTPIEWSRTESPKVGKFLIAAGPNEDPFSAGVVSVAERTLRESDQAFLGVSLDDKHEGSGVKVGLVDERGGADEAGIAVGDLILSLGGKAISSAFELRNALLKYAPGDQVKLSLERKGKALELEVDLGGRPMFPGVPEARLRAMRQMGGPISLVGKDFPVVIQTDMQLLPNECGGPVVDLDGEVIGMTISRTDRTRSFIIPSEEIELLLGRQPSEPSLANRAPTDAPRARARTLPGYPDSRKPPRAIPMQPGAAAQLSSNLKEMADLLEMMDLEMEKLGN